MNRILKYLLLGNRLTVDQKTRLANADKIMLQLIGLHWLIVSTFVALLFGSFLLGFIGGGLLFGIAWVAYRFFAGTQRYRDIMAVVFLSFSVIMIQQSFGRIEMHFHIFGTLSFFNHLQRYAHTQCWGNLYTCAPFHLQLLANV